MVEEIKECHERGQPVLVGTISVEKSERLSKLLKKEGVKHNVLNAVNHEAEANIIAQAGRKEAVTIATNMAGRGTDILLGGNPEFLARAEMENEWIQRVAKLASPEGTPAKRYEETLRELREKYDEEIERIRHHYEPQLQALDETRKEALRRETESRQKLLEGSPYREARDRYERYASSDLIPALGDGRAVTETYLRVKHELETELDAPGGAELEDIAAEFAAARTALDALLGEWADPQKRSAKTNVDAEVKEVLRRTAGQLGASNGHSLEAFQRLVDTWSFANVEKGENKTLADHLNSARVLYDRVLGDLEMELLLRGGDADGAGLAGEYQQAIAARRVAEEEHVAVEKPFEKALGDAHSRYESRRQEYVRTIDQIREQLDKAPQEFQGRFEEILVKYKQVCAQEREQVVGAGGLHIVGTERHESRRIDNQLRGRAGRQGDPGSSRFFLSLEDDLLRIFGADRIQGLMQRLGMEEGVPIEHRLITRAISNAQSKVEAHNFDIRKHLLEYDDVMNKQREVVYARRRALLSGERLRDEVMEIGEGLVEDTVASVVDADTAPGEWDWKALEDAIARQFAIRIPFTDAERENASVEAIADRVLQGFVQLYEAREREFTSGVMRQIEKIVMLQTLDGAVEGSPPQHGSSEGGDRAARLRAEEPAAGIPERRIRSVRSHARPVRVRDRDSARHRADRAAAATDLGARTDSRATCPGCGGGSADSGRATFARDDRHDAAARGPAPGRRAAAAPHPDVGGRTNAEDRDRQARCRKGRPQRAVPVREREEVQEVSWGVAASTDRAAG